MKSKMLAALVASASFLFAERLPAQDLRVGLVCEPGCSPERERTATARLSWQRLDIAEGSRLDLAVYDGGFENCGFASLVLMSHRQAEPEFACSGIEGLRPYNIGLAAVEPAAEDGLLSSVLLSDLEAGVNYQFRLRLLQDEDWLTTETIVCPAPVCISDNE